MQLPPSRWISVEANIFWLYLIKLSKWFLLTMPIVALFYKDNGLDTFDIYLLQGVYSCSVAILEIPSGYMADVVGRRKSLILGAILGTFGYLIYALSSSLDGFLFAEISLGLAGSFISGSDSALLYDSLLAAGRHNRYLQLEGRITALGNFAETFAAMGGGLLAAAAGYRAVYIAQFFVAALAIPASLLLLEPAYEKMAERPGISHIVSIFRTSLLHDRPLSAALLFSSVTGVATLAMAWTAQVFFVEQGLSEKSITPLWIALNLTVALVSAAASRCVAGMGRKNALLTIALIIPLSFSMLGLLPLPYALCMLFVFYAVRGYATPFLKDLVNMRCSSANRATVLSIRNMLIRIGFAIFGPLTGLGASRYGLSHALQGAGLVLFCLSMLFLLFFFLVERSRKMAK